MDNRLNDLYYEMIKYYENDPRIVAHFIKVHSFARAICIKEGVEKKKGVIAEAAALVHDIGIKECEAKYNSTDGYYQEIEGPIVAKPMLEKCGFSVDEVERICYLVGHHHTYTNIDDIDYQILVEADYLVNFYEEEMTKEQVMAVYDNLFKTDYGKELCELLYKLD